MGVRRCGIPRFCARSASAATNPRERPHPRPGRDMPARSWRGHRLRSTSAHRLSLAIVFRKLIVGPRGFTATPSHQTIEASKVSARGPPGKVICRLENGEFHRTHDELVQSCPILPSGFLNGPLKGSWQPESIVALCSRDITSVTFTQLVRFYKVGQEDRPEFSMPR